MKFLMLKEGFLFICRDPVRAPYGRFAEDDIMKVVSE